MTIARSLLFVPGDRPERFAKAAASGAHAVILDLEDAVAAAAKPAAREACRAWLDAGGRALLRVNALDTAWAEADLALARHPGVAGVVLPKAEQGADIDAVLAAVGPQAPVLPLIESAAGMLRVQDIAARPGVQRLLFGTVDFGLDLGIEGDGDELAAYRAQLVLVSRAAGLQPPVDGVTVALNDEAALAAAVQAARRVGFGGKLCIHPRQVAAVHAGFAPTPAQVEWATQVLARAEGAAGAFEFEGRMVDAPVLARARRILG